MGDSWCLKVGAEAELAGINFENLWTFTRSSKTLAEVGHPLKSSPISPEGRTFNISDANQFTGSFGSVSKIKRKSDGRILVWKELSYGRMNEKEKQQIVAEVNILRDLQHPSIVQYTHHFIDKKDLKIYIVMEYCAGGDLQRIVRRCREAKSEISEDFIWRIFAQIVSGLHYCHRRSDLNPINRGEDKPGQVPEEPQKVIHRDLKPGNIFLDANNDVKVGDFGLARVMNHDSVFAHTHVGTPYYMSPE